jgi:alpha-glucosidase (family GH31 glycosyl hydrolase)
MQRARFRAGSQYPLWSTVGFIFVLCFLIWELAGVQAAERGKYARCSTQSFCAYHRQRREQQTSQQELAANATAPGTRCRLREPEPFRLQKTSSSVLIFELLQREANDSGTLSQLQLEVGAVTHSIFSIRVREPPPSDTIQLGLLRRRKQHASVSKYERYSPVEDVMMYREPWLQLERLAASTATSCPYVSSAAWLSSDTETVIVTASTSHASTEPVYNVLRVQHEPCRIALFNNVADWCALLQNSTATTTRPSLVWNAAELLAWIPLDANTTAAGSVAADVAFPRAIGLYGLPEHALDLRLPTTCTREPLRLYNLDVFEYELNSELGLYGSIPFILALNGSAHTVGALWMPASETYVDLCPLLDQERGTAMPHAHFISERGIPEMFVFAGPSPVEVSQQLALLTGHAPLPPVFALGYHQSRWNYRDEADALHVDGQFDANEIPYDVLWLDIEHTDNKKYFTWDGAKFPDPARLQQTLFEKAKRKLVTIVDPHIKAEPNYSLHERALKEDWYVRSGDGVSIYEGWCWPGKSHYPDFMDPRVQTGWSSCFVPSFYHGMTEHLHIWVDMNEPSVFNGPEGTFPKNVRHRQGALEHSDIHNIYGHMVHRATFEGLYRGRQGNLRPFVLSRSFFTGSQRFGAVWTGDNAAQWSHLAASVPMLLSISVAGIAFVGADVGGFFGNPQADLLTRWYQAAAYQPFFRGHAHLDTKRREPWLFGEPYTSLIREAIQERYALLPYWYVLFAAERTLPVIRPLFYAFPDESSLAGVQSSWLLGDALLVAPVLEAAPSTHRITLPGPASLCWYPVLPRTRRLFSGEHLVHRGQDTLVYPKPALSSMYVFQRGGSIIPRWERQRRSSSLMLGDPLTLHVALDAGFQARGMLYLDDGLSYGYQRGDYCFWRIAAMGQRLANGSTSLQLRLTFQALDALPPPSNLSRCAHVRLERFVFYLHAGERVVVRKPALSVSGDVTTWQGVC